MFKRRPSHGDLRFEELEVPLEFKDEDEDLDAVDENEDDENSGSEVKSMTSLLLLLFFDEEEYNEDCRGADLLLFKDRCCWVCCRLMTDEDCALIEREVDEEVEVGGFELKTAEISKSSTSANASSNCSSKDLLVDLLGFENEDEYDDNEEAEVVEEEEWLKADEAIDEDDDEKELEPGSEKLSVVEDIQGLLETKDRFFGNIKLIQQNERKRSKLNISVG